MGFSNSREETHRMIENRYLGGANGAEVLRIEAGARSTQDAEIGAFDQRADRRSGQAPGNLLKGRPWGRECPAGTPL